MYMVAHYDLPLLLRVSLDDRQQTALFAAICAVHAFLVACQPSLLAHSTLIKRKFSSRIRLQCCRVVCVLLC